MLRNGLEHRLEEVSRGGDRHPRLGQATPSG
jgi:hypothetical protein